MKKFIIEEDFWTLFPQTKVGVVVCNEIDNKIKKKDIYVENDFRITETSYQVSK